jgi:hypothetical protein
MNSEAMLFNHEGFGEAFIGVARHAATMTQLERMIFEDCVFSGDGLGCGKVLAPHFNIKQDCRYHLRPESIQRRIQQAGIECSFHQATTLCDAWAIIEATEKMVDTFILWIKAKKSTEKAVAYFENLAMNLAEVEASDDDCECMDSAEPDFEESYAPAETIHYHPIGYDESEETVTWESKQPFPYRRLLARVRAINDLEQLNAIGKDIFEHGNLNHDQGGVFWYEYRQSKERIMKVVKSNLGSSARTLLNQINSRKSKELSAYGLLLYKLQSGQISMTDPPTVNEWTIIWKAYQARKNS